MPTLDFMYEQPNLIEIDPYQFKAFLFGFAREREKFPDYMMTADDKSDDSAMVLLYNDRYLFVYPNPPDKRWYFPKIDSELWEIFKKIDPVGSEPVLD